MTDKTTEPEPTETEASAQPPADTGARRGRPPRHSRHDILAAAGAAMAERGYDRVRYSDVSRRSGIPITSVRHYFATIGELRQATVRHLVEREQDAIETAVATLTDPWEQMRTICDMSVKAAVYDPSIDWRLWLEYLRSVALRPHLMEDYQDVNQRYLDIIGRVVEAGVAAGDFSPLIDVTETEEISRWILTTIDGYGLRLALLDSAAEVQAATRRTQRAVRLILGMPAAEEAEEADRP